MTDDELAELETQLAAKLRQITALNQEAAEMTARINAERDRRRIPATVHELHR